MICVQVLFENGNEIVTDFNGTFEDASKYYVGKIFQFGDTDQYPEDYLVKCISVKELKEN